MQGQTPYQHFTKGLKIISKLSWMVLILWLGSCFNATQFKIKRKIVSDQKIAKEIVSKHNITFSTPPSRIPVPYSVDAPLLGNGYTGVAISGIPDKQVYYLARNDFWRLKSSFNQCFPAVLGKVELEFPDLNGASYKVVQDLYSATTTSIFRQADNQVQIETFVSAKEDVMIMKMSMEGEGELRGRIRLTLPGEAERIDNPPFDLVFEDHQEQGIEGQGIYWISRGFEKDVDISTQAVCAFRILDVVKNTFQIKPGKPVIVVFAFSSNFKHQDCQKHVIEKVAGIDHMRLREIERNHRHWWADFWSKSWVEIPDKIIEKQYYTSNYALASCSRDPDFPPSIFGSWITRERPHWNGDYHLNYNHMAPYYGLYSANHIAQADPYNAPVLAMMERGSYYAKKVTGVENGILLQVGIGPMGMEPPRRNTLMETHRKNWIEAGNVEDEGLFYGQKSNASYCVVNMAHQFYYTYSLDYARKVYPFVKKVATFWENYLSFEKGRYVIYNDAIHEGTLGTSNPILSLGLIPMVMQTAIDMSAELSLDADRQKKWKHIIDHLSDYTYQERDGKKVFRYSEEGTSWWPDNTLGIQHIYPAGQIGLDSDPALLEVAHNTIEVMSRWSDFNGTNSFFPAAVRIGYSADTILSHLRRYALNCYPNGFILDNPHGIENFSTVPNTINEMLCSGHQGVLRVFPVWPGAVDARFSNIRIHGAFLVSAALKNGIVSPITIYSEKGKSIEFENPWPQQTMQIQRNGNGKKIISGKRIQINTKPGEFLTLTPHL